MIARFDRASLLDAHVLIVTGLCQLTAGLTLLLLTWARAGDDNLADLGDEGEG